MGDALAVVVSEMKNFQKNNFALFHPAGSLGKKLLIRVNDIMFKDAKNAVINCGATLQSAIVEMCKKELSLVNVVDEENRLVGIMTDGDLRRLLQKGVDIYGLNVDDVMTKSPKYIRENFMAVEALKIMNEKNITAMPVINSDDKVVGTIRIQEILNEGIYNED